MSNVVEYYLSQDAAGFHYHLSTTIGEGTARTTIDFDHAPTKQEFKDRVKVWLKELREQEKERPEVSSGRIEVEDGE